MHGSKYNYQVDFFLKDSEAKLIIYEEFSSEDVKLSENAKNLIKISVNSKIEGCINFEELLLNFHELDCSYSLPEDISLAQYSAPDASGSRPNSSA